MFFKYHHPQSHGTLRNATSVPLKSTSPSLLATVESKTSIGRRWINGWWDAETQGVMVYRTYMDLWSVSNYLWTEIIRLPLHDGSPNSPNTWKMRRFTTIDRTNCKWGMGWSFLGLSDDFLLRRTQLTAHKRCPILIETTWNYDICVAAVQPFGNRICGKCMKVSGFIPAGAFPMAFGGCRQLKS